MIWVAKRWFIYPSAIQGAADPDSFTEFVRREA
jgi:hypothetical protein